MTDPQTEIDRPEPEKCTCKEGYVYTFGEKERCPENCEDGWIYPIDTQRDEQTEYKIEERRL